MVSSMEKISADALGLPAASRALLAEKLLDSLSGQLDPARERAHLDEIRLRRKAARENKSTLIDGDEALRRARTAMRE